MGRFFYKDKRTFFWFSSHLYSYIFFTVGIILISLLIKNTSKPFPIESILYGICFGFIYGILTILHLSRNIIGNLYYRPSLSLKRAIYAIVVGLVISNITMFTYKFLKSGYYKYILLPAIIAISIGELITIIWLVNYEKIHGEVYIITRKNKQ